MATTLDELIEKAMALQSEERAELADLLVRSLDSEGFGRIESIWLTQAKRRRDEVRAGRLETLPGEEATRKIRDSLGR